MLDSPSENSARFILETASRGLVDKMETTAADMCADRTLQAYIWSSSGWSLTEKVSVLASFWRLLFEKGEALA